MDYFNKFKNSDPERILETYRSKSDTFWKNSGQKMALSLFKTAAKRVPAYKDFLQKNKINPAKINTIEDFINVPITDKENYINKYKLSDLCMDGKIESSYFLSASSGSTGIPNFWPRSTEQTYHGAQISEIIYKEYFECDTKSTLYIVAFAMGTWIAATYMMMATEWVAQKGYPITVVTPGLNKEEILKLVELGNKNYDQTILVGYPPFVKDIVDSGVRAGVDWNKLNIKFIFSGEAVTEKWREHIQSKTNFKNSLKDTVNIYGSADVGLVAHETVLTTYLRKLSMGNKTILQELFHAERVPSAYQYDPRLRYFEKAGIYLIITCPSGIPLIRYNTKDEGDTLYYEKLVEILGENKIDLHKQLKKQKVDSLLWKSPIVYLFGRGKFTARIYPATIYPENVKLVLEHKSLVNILTGKFVILTEESKDHLQRLHLHVELREGYLSKTKELSKLIQKIFVSEVSKTNSEYRNVIKMRGRNVHPKIFLHAYGDKVYFPRGIIKKNA